MINFSAHSRQVFSAVTVLIAFAGGFGFAQARSIEPASDPPAYLVVSSRVLDADAMGKYGEAAGPLAQLAGIEMVAGSPDPTVTVLEGSWPYEEGIVIEKFRSMDALKNYWYSDGYQHAKTLREGALKVNFIVAVAGVVTD